MVLKDVPPGTTVVGIPARPIGPQPVAVEEPCFPAYGTAPGAAVDPVARALDRLAEQVDALSARVVELEQRQTVGSERSARRTPYRGVVVRPTRQDGWRRQGSND